MVQSHVVKVQIDMTVSNPPLERILNIFNQFTQILINLTGPKSNMVSHQDIQEGGKIVVVNLRDYN